MERQRPKSPLWTKIILIAVLGLLYLPILVMVINSLVENSSGAWVVSLKWYQQIMEDQMLIEALQRSLGVSLSASTIATVIGTVTAVALARSRFRWSRSLEGLSFLSLIIPELVFALALLSWFYVLQMPLSLLTVVIAHVTFSLSFVLMTVNGRAVALDASLEDAARDLGASEWNVLRKIILPLLATSIASGFLLAFLLSFDDFLITFYTNGVGSDTLPIRLYTALKTGLSPKLSALATLMFIFSTVLVAMLFRFQSFNQSRKIKAL